MQIYLPIAEMPVSVLLILGLGAAVGFISGLFGIGGGFPDDASPFSRHPACGRGGDPVSSDRRLVDHQRLGRGAPERPRPKLGGMLVAGGLVGSALESGFSPPLAEQASSIS